MRFRAPRYVPLVSGLVSCAAAIFLAVLWQPPTSSGFYWVRNGIGAALAWYGTWEFKVAIFATDDQISRGVAGDVDVWKETAVAAPSILRIKDVILILAMLVILTLLL
jgi:hypothetical protein